MKHDLVYELLGQVLQLSFGHVVVFQGECLGQPERSELQYSSLESTKVDTSVFVESAERRCRYAVLSSV